MFRSRVIAPITWLTSAFVRSLGILAYTIARIFHFICTFIDIGASVDNVGVSLVAFGALAIVARTIFLR